MINWKNITNYLRLNVDDKILEITDSEISPEMADWVGNYMRKNNIDGIGFGDPFQKCSDLSFINQFPSLRVLGIGYSDFYISHINGCTDLEELSISHGFTGSIDFALFPNLKKVFIDWENAGVETLFNCPQLESVTILKYNGLSLSNFEALPNLKELVLYDPKVISLNGIGNLKYLEKLEIFNAKKLQDLGDIENVQTLKKLFLYGTKNLIDLTSIMYLKNLRALNLDNIGKTSTIRFLETLKNLEECYLTESTNVVDGDLSVLANLRANHNLNKVIFTNRNHYSHTREQLGYQVPASIAAIFKKKK